MGFSKYMAELQRNLKSGQATEPTYYPALKVLLESLDTSIAAFVNPKRTHHGSPDFSVRRKGNVLDFPVGWIEAKEIGEDLDSAEKSDQLRRYQHLPNLLLTDFLEFRWFTDGQRRFAARLGIAHRRKIDIDPPGEAAVRDLLLGFLQHRAPPARESRELARRMAQLAHFIRDAILNAYAEEGEGGKLHRQLQAFHEALLPDLRPDSFADMYAQTITYGLFAARCQPPPGPEGFSRERAAHLIPRTNPFLRKLFNEIAGPDLDPRIQPYVDDLVALLRQTDISSVLADFGKRTAKGDPVVHFYEDFLQAYDPAIREMRGVYYTPEPVVSYIVRAVDHVLKTKFGKPTGLADRDVLILDPACGTGTFLYYVIRHVYQTLIEHGQKGQWNSYVSQNLLKRVFGFELLMAPYAVAHLKLGLLLKELGYRFDADERLGIYLTNTLEEAIRRAQQIFAFAEAITDEAQAAARIKRDKPIMVVLGNPPYSGHSANRSWEIDNGKRRLTFIGHLLRDYYQVDGRPLGEKNPKWLQDDYVKFIRFAQWRIDRTGYGILGYITNHGYLDNPTFRGMRQQLISDFTEVHLLDLHGNTKKRERAPDGSVDENVFDIQQGVAIGVYIREPGATGPTPIHHADLWGTREAKYRLLSESAIQSTPWERLEARPPTYLFVPQRTDLLKEYEQGWKLTDIFPVNSVGIVTARDSLSIGFSADELWEAVQDFGSLPPEEARQRYSLGSDTVDWSVKSAQADLRSSGPTKGKIYPILYRPFDIRYTYYTGTSRGFACRPRAQVMRLMLAGTNLGLISARSNKSQRMDHFFVSRHITEAKTGESTTQSCLFPLYGYPTAEQILDLPGPGNAPLLNISQEFITQAADRLGLRFTSHAQGGPPGGSGPHDILAYAYAIFHSPGYREIYKEFLRIDFPRVPLTSDRELFAALVEKGRELVGLHLIESQKLGRPITRYEQPGDDAVEKIRYADANPQARVPTGRVYINSRQFFEGVTREVWEFQIGGYRVCQKWLKDRKGRKLPSDDIDHYQKIVAAVSETLRLMREINALIPHWPLT